jgi:hypothetical protein
LDFVPNRHHGPFLAAQRQLSAQPSYNSERRHD